MTLHDLVVQKLDLTKEVTSDALVKAYNDARSELLAKFHSTQGVFTGELTSLEERVASAVRSEVAKATAFVGLEVEKEAKTHPWVLAGAGLLVGLLAGASFGATVLAHFIR